MQVPSRIFLTGFMASGKTTLGPALASELHYAFLDLDDQIEARAGMQIADIFRRRGEAAFREFEAAALRATGKSTGVVVALGGGALARDDNLSFALHHGLVVYLYAKVDTLVRRLENEPVIRPMLRDGAGRPMTESTLRRRIKTLLRSREHYYKRAHVILNVDKLSIDQAKRDLKDAILAYAEADGLDTSL